MMTRSELPDALTLPAADPRLPALEPTRLYRQIAGLIGERIDNGQFPAGSLLPAERDLAQQLGVSRTSVREALIALEVSGKVSIRVGHGVRVLEATPRPERVGAGAHVNDAEIGPLELMAARLHVETKTAELAALHRSRRHLERLDQAIRVQARATSVRAPEWRGGDRAFHIELARAGGNAAFVLVIAELWDHCCKPMFEKFEELLTGPERLELTAAEHRRIFTAVLAGDPAAARKAMKLHLTTVRRAFSRGLGAT